MAIILSNPLIMPNIGLMFWTLLIFMLLIVALRKYAWGPIMSGLKARETSIQSALDEAKKAREEMGNLLAENEALLAQARLERDKILRDAKEVKDKLISDATAKAQDEYNRILNQSKADIEKEKNAAMKELREQVVGLAMEAATRILQKELTTTSQQEELIEGYINQVNNN